MTEREPAEIGGRYRLTAAQAAPPPLAPLAAVDAKTGSPCEAWLVPPGLPGLDYGALGRAAAVFAGVGHPSLQDLLGIFAGPGGDYWIYEAPPGGSFEALAGEGRPFTEAQAADMAASLCGALKKLHGRHPRACHGAVSPRNIYLAGNGRAVLGAIKPFLRGEEEVPFPVLPGEAGTPGADIYSLGASLVFLLTGKKTGPGKAGPASADLAGGLPFSPEFVRVIKKMTAAAPLERYQSAAELEADLAALLTGRKASKLKPLLRAAALFSLLAAAAWGAFAFLSGNGAEVVLNAGSVGLEAAGGLAFSRDGGRLALAGDRNLYLWDTKNWEPEKNGAFTDPVKFTRSVNFLPDGRVLAGYISGTGISASGEGSSALRLFSSSPGDRSRLLEIPLGKNLDSAAVSPDGTLVAAAVNEYNELEQRYLGGEITVFDTAGRVVYKPALAGGPVHSLVFTPDGRGLVYKTYFWDQAGKAYNSGCIALRDLASGSERILLREKTGPGSGLFSYGPAGLLATPEGREEVMNITDASGRRLATLNQEAYKEEYRYMFLAEGAFSANGKLFAAHFTSRNIVYIRLFETAGWKLVKTFRLGSLDRGGVAAIAFSPDGKRLAAAQGALVSRVYVFSLEGEGG